jgi:hypothetical protein
VIFVSHVTVEEIVVPERASLPDDLVCLIGREGLPAVEDRAKSVSREGLDNDMNVVRHYAPGQQAVALSIEMEKGIFNEFGNIGPAQPASTATVVEFLIYASRGSPGKAKGFGDGARQTVGQPERHELDGLGRIEVRQITSGMPAFVFCHL